MKYFKDNTANGFQAGLTFLALCLLTGSIVAVIVGRSVARPSGNAVLTTTVKQE